jgi:hypothetical protein
MTSHVDLAVSVGLFLTFVAVLFVYMTSFLSSYYGLKTTSELRTLAYDIFNTMFGGKGVPSNWEIYNRVPVRVGLITDLHRIPVNITETGGSDRGNITVNVSISFDASCSNKSWNDSIRLYNSSYSKVEFQLYNQTFCSENFLQTADVVFNVSLNASQNKLFFVYFSPQRNITPVSYSVVFTNTTDYTAQVYPEEKFNIVSVDKLKGLRNLNYDEVIRTLGIEYKFKVEVSES